MAAATAAVSADAAASGRITALERALWGGGGSARGGLHGLGAHNARGGFGKRGTVRTMPLSILLRTLCNVKRHAFCGERHPHGGSARCFPWLLGEQQLASSARLLLLPGTAVMSGGLLILKQKQRVAGWRAGKGSGASAGRVYSLDRRSVRACHPRPACMRARARPTGGAAPQLRRPVCLCSVQYAAQPPPSLRPGRSARGGVHPPPGRRRRLRRAPAPWRPADGRQRLQILWPRRRLRVTPTRPSSRGAAGRLQPDAPWSRVGGTPQLASR